VKTFLKRDQPATSVGGRNIVPISPPRPFD